jgi:type III secretory pathway component EscR
MEKLTPPQQTLESLALLLAFFARAPTLIQTETLWMEEPLAARGQFFPASATIARWPAHSDSFSHFGTSYENWPT